MQEFDSSKESLMADIFSLAGSHVLVTGASSALGRHFASRLARAGATVTLAARREQALAAGVKGIAESGGKAAAVLMDVSDSASVERALDAAEKQFGPVSVLINNAGVTETRPALEVDEGG
jgi:NAD(P)-dependent dehydrogenase (short-subunit alcohol dehydrogenase family)